MSRSLARVPFAYEVEVVLRAPLADVRRRVPPSVGELTEVEAGVLVTMRAERLDGAAQMLAGLGWPFVVRRPAELRVAVRALAESLRQYADAPMDADTARPPLTPPMPTTPAELARGAYADSHVIA